MAEVVEQVQAGLSTPSKVTPVGSANVSVGWVAGPAWRLSAGPTDRPNAAAPAGALPIVTGMARASPA